MEILAEFQLMVAALGAMASLMLVQILLADVLAIRAKHTPGTPVDANHDNLLFRVTRVVANTNESIAVFILAVIFCVLSEASPLYTAYGAWGYVFSRAAYSLCYYFDLRTLRSVVFGVSLVFLVVLLLIGAYM
jgi:uncharacterized MAPEG superfamily protein